MTVEDYTVKEITCASFFDELRKIAALEQGQVRSKTPLVHDFTTLRKKLRPGDIIFTKPSLKGSSALDSVVSIYDKLTGAKHPGWIHGALYLGDGKVGHLHNKKVVWERL